MPDAFLIPTCETSAAKSTHSSQFNRFDTAHFGIFVKPGTICTLGPGFLQVDYPLQPIFRVHRAISLPLFLVTHIVRLESGVGSRDRGSAECIARITGRNTTLAMLDPERRGVSYQGRTLWQAGNGSAGSWAVVFSSAAI